MLKSHQLIDDVVGDLHGVPCRRCGLQFLQELQTATPTGHTVEITDDIVDELMRLEHRSFVRADAVDADRSDT